MLRRPPTSTLFPTRRSSDLIFESPLRHGQRSAFLRSRLLGTGGPLLLEGRDLALEARHVTTSSHRLAARCLGLLLGAVARSEEHTSELQSRLHLVCRLLLEK